MTRRHTTDRELVDSAKALVGKFPLAEKWLTAGSVAAALRTKSGKVYTGICLDLSCGIGFCAEHAAIAEMLKARETEIVAIVAVNARGVLYPCGRCRELMLQVNATNKRTRVITPGNKTVALTKLLPRHWMDGK
jgi:cytidine deaminase